MSTFRTADIFDFFLLHSRGDQLMPIYICSFQNSSFWKSIVTTTEYPKSGNGHFLAYIPSCWKNQPSLVRVGGASPPPFTIYTIKYKVAMYAPAERADTVHSLLNSSSSLPYVYVICVGCARPLAFICCNIFFRLRGCGPVGPGAGGCHRCGQQGLQQQPAADRRTEAAPPPATRQVGYSTVQYSKISV
jgi:hypothetical protein